MQKTTFGEKVQQYITKITCIYNINFHTALADEGIYCTQDELESWLLNKYIPSKETLLKLSRVLIAYGAIRKIQQVNTLLELAGVDPLAHQEGNDLLPI